MSVSYEQMAHRCQRCARYFVKETAVCLGDVDEVTLCVLTDIRHCVCGYPYLLGARCHSGSDEARHNVNDAMDAALEAAVKACGFEWKPPFYMR